MRRLLFIFALGLCGCPDMTASPVPTVCVKQFEKCKLPTGPLGVCQESKCADGAKPPCLKCVGQH